MFQKNSFKIIIKVTSIDEIKIPHDKIKESQAQYKLDREAANISALSSPDLQKYKYVTKKKDF